MVVISTVVGVTPLMLGSPIPFLKWKWRSLSITGEIIFPRIPYVVLTGGEPLMQEGAIPFLEALVAHGAKPLLETNGSLPIKDVPKEVLIVMDLKPPHLGWKNLTCMKICII
jgi:hypothetical protein